MLPEFITFTGADDNTSIPTMTALSKRYPIEWGILFSPKQQGNGRYPSKDFIDAVIRSHYDIKLSMHICGDYARQIFTTGRCTELEPYTEFFSRMQINGASETDVEAVLEFEHRTGIQPILQARGDSFPEDDRVSWLFDKSGGNGIRPKSCPQAPKGRFVGYAGGIGPDNVDGLVDSLFEADRYWLDMETKLRIDDRFSLAICEDVCKRVYGPTNLELKNLATFAILSNVF